MQYVHSLEIISGQPKYSLHFLLGHKAGLEYA